MWHVAAKIGRKPSEVDEYIANLEANWVETVGAALKISDEQWTNLGVPAGLVNHIKAAMSSEEPLKLENQPAVKGVKDSFRGTPGHAAPEVLGCQGSTVATDFFLLGIVAC